MIQKLHSPAPLYSPNWINRSWEVRADMVDRNVMLKRISAYQFAIYDLALFLDSHPCDDAGIQLMRMYQDKLACLINEYEQHYGPLIQNHLDVRESWSEWVRDPWPWDNCKGGV